jgi:DNA-directed RNA polymerase subunit RPC12/RpoP
MIAVMNKTYAMYVGTGLLFLAGLSIVTLVVMLLTKRGVIMKRNEANKKSNIIKDTKIESKVENTNDALGADFQGDYELNNVNVKLEAKNVERATGARFTSTNGSTPLTAMIMNCSNCGKNFNKAFTGYLPEKTACPYCGYMNEVKKQ